MIELSPANLATFFTQIFIVVALAAVGARMFDVPVPRVRLGFWRAVVVLCLVLPFISLRQTPVEPSAISVVNATVDATSDGTVGAPAGSETIGWRPSEEQWTIVLLVAILTGILVRGAWLTVGFVRLRRLLRTSIAVSVDAEVDRLRAEFAPRAEIKLSASLHQPVTFGLIRPVILLSERALALPELERQAVICHELLHVRRHDWAWTLVEEALRSMFWFHPAMRYAIARVQSGREELVDADVIARTGARHDYIRALLAFADHPDLALAPSFVGGSQLRLRLRRITEEVQMSRVRLRVTVLAHAGVLLGAIALASLGLPYDVRAQQQPEPPPRDAVKFTVPLSRAVVRMDRPTYPPDAWRAGIGAEVSMLVTVSASGLTTVHGDPEWRVTVSSTSPADAVQSFWAKQGWRDFIASVNEAVRQWQYVPAESDVTVAARVSFQPPSPSVSRYQLGMATYFEQASTQGQFVFVRALGERYRAVNPAAVIDLQTLLPVGVQAVLRVGGNVREPQRVYGLPPVYPEAAKAARVQGDVILEVLIGVDGTVQDLRVLRSIPLLDQAALDTVRTWVFSTTLVDGAPQEVIANVTVNFTLPDQP